MNEIWQDIEGYEGLYQVSNLGGVKSLGNNKARKEKILKPFINKGGYQLVRLYKDGKKKNFQVHRLVYETFCGEIPSGMQVNHINEDKTDNRLCNLNLMTQKENCNWGTRNERSAKARSKQVVGYDSEGNVVVTFQSAMEAGRNGYTQSNISECCSGKRHQYKGLIWKFKDWDC